MFHLLALVLNRTLKENVLNRSSYSGKVLIDLFSFLMLGSGIQNLIDNSVTDDQSGTTENLFFWGGGGAEVKKTKSLKVQMSGGEG